MELLETSPRLTDWEKQQAALYTSGDWAVLSHDDLTGITLWVRAEGTTRHFRETQQVEAIVEENKSRQSDWKGFDKSGHGAVIRSIPLVEYNRLKLQCGFDGFEWDRKHMNKLLNDSDNAAWKVAPGKY